eukprot:SAG11_NODE_1177_length_5600_cov_2.043447_6_plen_288_part_00
MGVGLSKGDTKRHAFQAQLEDGLAGRLALGCGDYVAASAGGGISLYVLYRQVLAEQAERSDKICPKLGTGFTNPWPFCSSDGVYDVVKSFVYTVCEAERNACAAAEDERLEAAAGVDDALAMSKNAADLLAGDDSLTSQRRWTDGERSPSSSEPPPPSPPRASGDDVIPSAKAGRRGERLDRHSAAVPLRSLRSCAISTSYAAFVTHRSRPPSTAIIFHRQKFHRQQFATTSLTRQLLAQVAYILQRSLLAEERRLLRRPDEQSLSTYQLLEFMEEKICARDVRSAV